MKSPRQLAGVSRRLLGFFSGLCLLGPSSVLAAASYGILPQDVGSAQALSPFSSRASAAFYNPAALVLSPRGELTGAILHADHELNGRSLGGEAPLERDGQRLSDTPSQQLQLGLKTDLSGLTLSDHPILLGVMLGSDRFTKEIMAFEAATSREGQFMRYQRQPLLLSVGVGTRVWRGLNLGAGVRVTLRNEADLFVNTDLGGNTESEALSVSASPTLSPVVGATLDLGETFGGGQGWMQGLSLAASYRGYASNRTQVAAEAEIDGVVQDPGLELALNTFDAFTPATFTLASQYLFGTGTTFGLALEYQDWSKVQEDLARDTVHDQAQIQFRDVLIPRLGFAHPLNDWLTVRGGVAWERSALESGPQLNVNYLDNDRIVLGVGASATLPQFAPLAYPITLEFGYQYQELRDRDFELYSDDPANPTGPDAPFETLQANGSVHVFSGSLTLTF
ncbi:MAG: aromatic hydrocarbon degradation protein [Halomonadaceae bacterium]|nr:MAG: aromatic hydrocarbon degradation protein [Halomonadaceae bacterium]